jgi:glycosyltransferase involved in cell wall biosynthesis
MLPLISIGLPVYNGQKYLKRAITNILAQDYENLELLISDNCSNDTTQEICEEFCKLDRRIKYIRQNKNIGGAANYKEVLFKSNGTFFMWHAADDWIENKKYISNLYNNLKGSYDFALPEVKIVYEGAESSDYVFSKFFTVKQEKIEFVLAAAKNSNYQFYSLFKKSKLIKFWPFLWKCRNYETCWEGLFVNVFNLELRGVFVRSSTFVYFKNSDSWSSSLPASRVVKAFFMYSFNSFSYILRTKHLKFIQKYKILYIFFIQHFRTLTYLCLSAMKDKIIKRT